jgi:hypothetical protein
MESEGIISASDCRCSSDDKVCGTAVPGMIYNVDASVLRRYNQTGYGAFIHEEGEIFV